MVLLFRDSGTEDKTGWCRRDGNMELLSRKEVIRGAGVHVRCFEDKH